MAKIKVKNTELNKLDKAISEVNNQLENYYKEKDSVNADIQAIENDIQENNNLIQDFSSGNIPMDINKYMTTKHKIVLLEEQKGIKTKALNELDNDFKGLEDILINNVFNSHKDDVVNEYRDNRYNIINEMFIKMMEVAELSNQLNDESKKYYQTLQMSGHPKASIYRFDTSLNLIWKRFIFDGVGCRYTKALTSNILEFEEKYYNSLDKSN